MSISLKQILFLVGKLTDEEGEGSAQDRFRSYLVENVTEVGQVRDYIEECLRTAGDQYNRAFQDLINHLGDFLGFNVTFGRYRGVQGRIGYDGLWRSPSGYHVVIEVKTTDVYAIKAATLIGYVDGLISERTISSWEDALGLYVVGRKDPQVRQLENAIIAEKRTHQLRVISVDSLLSLAEMMNEFDVSHEDILDVIRPSGPTVDPVVDLMARLVAQRKAEDIGEKPQTEEPRVDKEVACWLTPVKSDEVMAAEDAIRILVGEEQIYAFGERTPGRKHLKPGDYICFYATGNGVVAHAKVRSKPEHQRHPKVSHPDQYPWVFRLGDTHLYIEDPIVIDADLRARLDAFQGRDPSKSWAWFVQATRNISKHDFNILTGQNPEE
jgi:hypothetical protein